MNNKNEIRENNIRVYMKEERDERRDITLITCSSEFIERQERRKE